MMPMHDTPYLSDINERGMALRIGESNEMIDRRVILKQRSYPVIKHIIDDGIRKIMPYRIEQGCSKYGIPHLSETYHQYSHDVLFSV
jgi:hypothetical protein